MAPWRDAQTMNSDGVASYFKEYPLCHAIIRLHGTSVKAISYCIFEPSTYLLPCKCTLKCHLYIQINAPICMLAQIHQR